MSAWKLIERYVAAWNAGDLDTWLELHHGDVEFVTLAGDQPRSFHGHEGLREVWGESRANWDQFAFAIAGELDGVVQVDYRGVVRLGHTVITGSLWFRVEPRDERIVRVVSAPDPALLG